MTHKWLILNLLPWLREIVQRVCQADEGFCLISEELIQDPSWFSASFFSATNWVICCFYGLPDYYYILKCFTKRNRQAVAKQWVFFCSVLITEILTSLQTFLDLGLFILRPFALTPCKSVHQFRIKDIFISGLTAFRWLNTGMLQMLQEIHGIEQGWTTVSCLFTRKWSKACLHFFT
jgi:hypothetical protein